MGSSSSSSSSGSSSSSSSSLVVDLTPQGLLGAAAVFSILPPVGAVGGWGVRPPAKREGSRGTWSTPRQVASPEAQSGPLSFQVSSTSLNSRSSPGNTQKTTKKRANATQNKKTKKS